MADTVRRIGSARTADGRRPAVRSLIVTSGSERFEHVVDDRPADVRSISKVAVAAAVGVGIGRGESLGTSRLDLDLPVVELFAQVPDIWARSRPSGWDAVTVGNLLNCTIGHDTGFLFRRDLAGRDPADLLGYLFDRPLPHPPGQHFAYSNVGAFLLSVLVTELTGRPLAEWVADRLFTPLGIPTPHWRRYGRYAAGGTGLSLAPAQLHDLAELFRRGGRAAGATVLPGAWVATMTRTSLPSPLPARPGEVLPKIGYGYGMWTGGEDRYFCDGTDGQYLIVDPRHDLAITTLADEFDMATLRSCLRPLLAGWPERPPELPEPGVLR
jgi:CubicO group peptidase (beta-lactamase class C family)